MKSPLARLREELAQGLEARRGAGLLRRRSVPRGIDLTTNDVLGLARDAWIAERVAEAVLHYGVGAGAARLLGGNLPLHEECERTVARFSGREDALLFPSGYMANAAALGGLVGPSDVVLSDRDNHASLIDGIRLSRASCRVLDFDDLPGLAEALSERGSAGRTLLVCESVVSTSGRQPALGALADLAEHHGALLLVDEAHATGLFGPRGSGRVEALGLTERVAATVHTGGKALGVAGAWVAGDAVFIEHLVNHARPFLFTTAPMPALAAGLSAALERLSQLPGAAQEVLARADALRTDLRSRGLSVSGDGTHIVSVRVGEAAEALAWAGALESEGFFVRALRPPTVRPGEACLRLVPHRDTRPADLERCAAALLRLRPAPRAPQPRDDARSAP